MNLLLLLAFLVSQATGSYYEIPFGSIVYPNAELFINLGALYVNVSVGDPPQLATVRLHRDYYSPNPVFSNGKSWTDGNYDPAKSASFVGEFNRRSNPIHGTETISFVKGFVHRNISLQVANDNSHWSESTSIGFGYNHSIPSFIKDYLKTQKHQVATLAFDRVGSSPEELTNGTLVLAEVPTDLCGKKWNYMPVFSTVHSDWTMKIDKIQVGNFNQTSPPANLTFSINCFNLNIPEPLYSNFIQELGISDYKKEVDCDIKKEIKLTVNGNILTIGPAIYVDKSEQYGKGKCRSRIDSFYDTLDFPMSFLNSKCLLFDYEKLRIGLATSKHNK